MLEIIDESLALDDTPVRQRVIKASQQLVDEFILSVQADDSSVQEPRLFNEYNSKPWFKAIYSHVEKWYMWRYGERLAASSLSVMQGVILIKNTPYLIQVPVTKSRIEVVGEQSWLSFPNQVCSEEDVFGWVDGAPRWDSYQDRDRQEIEIHIREISTLIRRIMNKKIGAFISDSTIRNLLAGVIVHLGSACTLIFKSDEEGGFARAQWELQMACESAYKALLQQKIGSFPQTHDLFILHDKSGITEEYIDREWIKVLPRWNEAANLRYGLGSHPSTAMIFQWYKLALMIIAGVTENISGTDLSNAQILLKIAPWLSSDQNRS